MGYEVKVASCETALGTARIFLKQFEKAEEHFNRSIDLLQNIMKKDFNSKA